jgi:phenazine biosynthesis-like protein/ABC transporter family protein
MPRSRSFAQVDVFSAIPYLGNPVAVVLDGTGLADEQMRRLARWTNLSETTFLLPPTTAEADYRLRIFSPGSELPFAGHPTLGSARAWLDNGGTPRHPDRIVQECAAGLISVRRGEGILSFAAPPLVRDGALDEEFVERIVAADMLHLTRNLNRRFDRRYAETRLGELGIPLKRKAGKLSGGQRAQLALTLALARRPRLLVLDEPVAMLDPVARHDFMATVLTAMADDGVSVVLSSHVLADLERVADYLILLSRGGVQVAGEVDDLLAGHRVLTGPARSTQPSEVTR